MNRRLQSFLKLQNFMYFSSKTVFEFVVFKKKFRNQKFILNFQLFILHFLSFPGKKKRSKEQRDSFCSGGTWPRTRGGPIIEHGKFYFHEIFLWYFFSCHNQLFVYIFSLFRHWNHITSPENEKRSFTIGRIIG